MLAATRLPKEPKRGNQGERAGARIGLMLETAAQTTRFVERLSGIDSAKNSCRGRGDLIFINRTRGRGGKASEIDGTDEEGGLSSETGLEIKGSRLRSQWGGEKEISVYSETRNMAIGRTHQENNHEGLRPEGTRVTWGGIKSEVSRSFRTN